MGFCPTPQLGMFPSPVSKVLLGLPDRRELTAKMGRKGFRESKVLLDRLGLLAQMARTVPLDLRVHQDRIA